MLNNSIARFIIKSYVSLHPSPHVVDYLNVKKWDNSDTEALTVSQLSQRCHAAAAEQDRKTIAALEAQIDKTAAKLWGITEDELKAIQEALAETGKSKRAAKDDDSE
jgi:hypothetical protein